MRFGCRICQGDGVVGINRVGANLVFNSSLLMHGSVWLNGNNILEQMQAHRDLARDAVVCRH